MSSIKREEELGPSNNLTITIEAMMKQFEHLATCFNKIMIVWNVLNKDDGVGKETTS